MTFGEMVLLVSKTTKPHTEIYAEQHPSSKDGHKLLRFEFTLEVSDEEISSTHKAAELAAEVIAGIDRARQPIGEDGGRN
jgi:hypothetical protein